MINGKPSSDIAAAFVEFKESNHLPDVSIETLLNQVGLTKAQSEWLQEHTLTMLLAEFCASNNLPFEDAESLLMFHRLKNEAQDWLVTFVKSWEAMLKLHQSGDLGSRLKFGTAMNVEDGSYVPAYFFDNGHFIITNPTLSEDGRFEVDPTSAYGLTKTEADLLVALNAARGVL